MRQHSDFSDAFGPLSSKRRRGTNFAAVRRRLPWLFIALLLVYGLSFLWGDAEHARRGAKRPASNVSAMAKPPATGETAEVSAERARVLDEQRGGLRALGLSKVYDGAKKPAVVNVQFGVNDGECFGLLGSNGAGAGARWHRRHRPRHPPSAPGWADSS